MPIGREVVGQKHQTTKEIPIPEWGGSILVRTLGHLEVVDIQMMAADVVDIESKSLKDSAKVGRFVFKLIRLSWINPDGSPVLSDTPEDYEWLMSEPDSVVKGLRDALTEFNSMNPKAADDAKKNSQPNLNGASGSSSPLLSAAAQ